MSVPLWYGKESDRMRKIECEQEFDSEFTAFLDSLKPHSKNAYRSLFAYWVNFTHMNGKETLEFRKKDTDALTQKKVVAFKQYLIGLGKSENFARLGTGAIRGFLSSHRLKLEFIPSEKRQIQEANRNTFDYLFTKEDLAKMSEFANLQERYILLVGKSVGLRAGDFLSFTYGTFRGIHLDGEAPISLGEIVTQKEHVKAFPFLDSDAVQIVKALLTQNPEAKNEEKILTVDEEQLTVTLKRLFEKAHLESGSKMVRFHNLRKYLFDKLSCVMSEEKAKQIIGKKVRENAYLGIDSLRECYLRAMPSIIINGNGKSLVKIEQLENALSQAESDRLATQTRLEQVLKKNEELLKILAKREIEKEPDGSKFGSKKGRPPTERETETEKLRKFLEG
jgi:hypothetical protein